MDTHRAEIELENKKLRSQIDEFQSELRNLRGRVQGLVDENDSLRLDLRRSVEERLAGIQPNALLTLNNDSVSKMQERKIELLEEEKEQLTRLYEESREIILRMQEEIKDLRDPLKPHLMKLDLQTKQVEAEHARAEGELIQEINMIREELAKRNKELISSQLRMKELERENERLQAEVYEKQDNLRQYLKKELGYDGTIVAFQSSIDALEVRLEHALREKETAQQQREELESKMKNLDQQNGTLREKLAETTDRLQQQMQMPLAVDTIYDRGQDLIEHEQVHRTIDELIAQAAMKARDAVEEVRQQYNENLEKIMQEYNRLETDLNQKQLQLEKALRGKRLVEEELDKILQERKLNLEKSAFDHQDLAKRCFQAERERDDTQIKLEQLQQNHKILQQSFEAEKASHQLKQKEFTDRLQKVNSDLDRTTNDYTMTFNELNELKKRLSSLQNEQNMMQRRMTDLVKRHEEQMLEKEKDCLVRLAQRDDVNRGTFNELRNLVNRQQRMIVKYKEECHTIASQSETKINELKQKIEHLRTRNEQLQSDMADLQRKDAEMNRILTKNANRIKTLEERLKDAEDQAIEASRRVAKQLVRDRLAVLPSDHFGYSALRSNPLFPSTGLNRLPIDSPEHISDEK